MLAVSSAMNMRAGDQINRYAFFDLQPLAVAMAVIDATRPQKPIRRALMDLQRETHTGASSDARRHTVRWFSKFFHSGLTKMWRDLSVHSDGLQRPTLRGPKAPCYCLRCHNQSTFREGMFRTCGGVPLVPFSSGNGAGHPALIFPDSERDCIAESGRSTQPASLRVPSSSAYSVADRSSES